MTSYIRKFELGGLHIESTKDATTYVGDKNDVWTDDNAPGTWRIGDGATPGGVVLFSAAGGGGGGGIALTDISVVQNPVGISGLSWNNVTGVLSYTPPDLTGYALSNSVPGDLTELGINDGTNGQVLTTDGAGTFTFTTLPSTGITYSDLSVTQNPAAGLGTLAYNNTTGTFTYTPPDLSSFGAGGADTGDFTFTNTTIGAPDQEVINIQATNADSDINSRLVLDPEYGTITLEATSEESSRYYDSSSWGTATWANNGHGYGVVTITSASTVYDFLNAFPSGTTWSLDVTTASGTQNFAGGGYGYSFGSQTLTLNTSTTYPDPSEEVTSIRFRYTYNSYISVDYDNEIALIANDLNIDLTSTRDVNIRAGDDLQLYSNDIFTLYNDSTTVPIRIVTDNSNTSKTWAFEADGSITFPDSSSQTTAWTGTATTLDSQAPSYYLDYTNFTNTPTIPADVSDLTDTTNLLSGSSYGDADVATYLNGNLDTSIIPDTNSTYDIGSAEFKIRHLYLSQNSLKFVDSSDIEYSMGVNSTGNKLEFNSETVATSSYQVNDTPAAIDITKRIHFIGHGLSYTLADGTYIGQELHFVYSDVGTGSSSIVVDNAKYTDAIDTTSARTAFSWILSNTAPGEKFEAIWDGTGWCLIGGEETV